jgi:hypothetical protein
VTVILREESRWGERAVGEREPLERERKRERERERESEPLTGSLTAL